MNGLLRHRLARQVFGVRPHRTWRPDLLDEPSSVTDSQAQDLGLVLRPKYATRPTAGVGVWW